MSNKALSIYFTVFSILYIGYTAIVIKHGLHWTNIVITIFVLMLAVYYYLKDKKLS